MIIWSGVAFVGVLLLNLGVLLRALAVREARLAAEWSYRLPVRG